MDERQLAMTILATGIQHGKGAVSALFGEDVIDLIQQTYGELHKNNLPEEELIFVMKKATDHESDSTPERSEVATEVTIEQIHAMIRELDDYKNEKRMPEIDDFRQKSVIKDFVYYLSKQFFYHNDVFEQVVKGLEEAGS